MAWRRLALLVKNAEKYLIHDVDTGTRVLNYGCGQRKGDHEVGVDISTDTDADVLVGPDGRLPFPENSFDLVISRYVFEHVFNLLDVLAEIERVLKPGGKLRFIVPHCFSQDAFDDPTHVQFFTLRTVRYLTGEAQVHYSKKRFSHGRSYLRVTLGYPRSRIVRYPATLFIGAMGVLFPNLAEQCLKLPFLTGSVITELTKES